MCECGTFKFSFHNISSVTSKCAAYLLASLLDAPQSCYFFPICCFCELHHVMRRKSRRKQWTNTTSCLRWVQINSIRFCVNRFVSMCAEYVDGARKHMWKSIFKLNFCFLCRDSIEWKPISISSTCNQNIFHRILNSTTKWFWNGWWRTCETDSPNVVFSPIRSLHLAPHVGGS